MSSEIQSINEWFNLAKPNHTIEDACVQIGCHFEEVAEMIESIFGDRNEAFIAVNKLAKKFKSKNPVFLRALMDLTTWQKRDLLDSLCDQNVTLVGSAKFLNFDFINALNEVNNSNYSKFEYGKPVFNDQGKISKGVDYFPPCLDEFIDG